jgi:hypothetical protein
MDKAANFLYFWLVAWFPNATTVLRTEMGAEAQKGFSSKIP